MPIPIGLGTSSDGGDPSQPLGTILPDLCRFYPAATSSVTDVITDVVKNSVHLTCHTLPPIGAANVWDATREAKEVTKATERSQEA